MVRFDKPGEYRLDAPAGERLRLKVFRGRAVVSANESDHKVKKKWSLALAEAHSTPLLEKFDSSKKDVLDQWHQGRVDAIEQAVQERKRADRRDREPGPYGPVGRDLGAEGPI